MKINLFDIENGKPKITKHVQDIWYLKAIVDDYGEAIALKLFKIFDFMFNLDTKENPYVNIKEINKFETILRSTYPELEKEVDLDSNIIELAMDLVEELYETPKYRAYKVIKKAHEKLLNEVEHTPFILTKEDGNMSDITKALTAFEDLGKKLSNAYIEVQEEIGGSVMRGGRDSKDRRVDGKAKELL